MEEMEALLKELQSKLTIDAIEIRDSQIIFYDFYGVTFREDVAEAAFADLYVQRLAEEKLGCKIRVTYWSDGGNGHFAHKFVRRVE